MSIKTDFLSIFPTSPEEMKMNLFTLSFDGKLEDQYKHHEIKKELGQRRIGLVIAVIIYALFGMMDMFLMPEVKYVAWFIRFGLFIPLSLLVFMASYWERVESWMEAFISVVIVASGIGHLVILAYAPPAVSTHYYMGLVIFMLFSLTILRTDFIKSLISGFIIFLGYIFYAMQIEKADFSRLYSSVFILLSCWIISAAACYLLEYKSRRNYYLYQIIHTGQLPKLPAGEVVKEKTVVKTVESPVNKLYEHLTDFVWFLSTNGELKYLSPSVKDFLGYEPEELEGRRANQIHTTDSFKLLESEIQRLGHSVNKLSLNMEYKTRAGLIKEGHAVIVKYQDKRMGEGYLGSTRVDQEVMTTATGLDTADSEYLFEEFEKEKERLHAALLEAQAELDRLKGIEEHQIEPLHVEMPVHREAAVVSQIFEGFKRDQQTELIQSIEKLALKARQIEEKFAHQTMKKYDLETYLKETLHQTTLMEKRVNLQRIIQEVFVNHVSKSEPAAELVTAQADALIQKAIIPLSPIFKGTEYVIDFDCPQDIEMSTHKELFKAVVQSLIALSILYGFKSTTKGVIELKAELRDSALVMHYLDDGVDYVAQGMDLAMNQMFGWDQRNPYVFNMIKQLVEERLKGTLGFDLSESRNAIRVVLPLKP